MKDNASLHYCINAHKFSLQMRFVAVMGRDKVAAAALDCIRQ